MSDEPHHGSSPTAMETAKKAPCSLNNQTHVISNDPRKSNRTMSYIIPPMLVVIAIFSTYVWFDMCIQWYLKNGYKAAGVCLLLFQIALLILMGSSFLRIVFTRAGYLPNAADRARVAHIDFGESDLNNMMTPQGTIHTANEFDEKYHKTYDRRPTNTEVRKCLATPRLTDVPAYIARSDPSDSPRYCSVCDLDKYDRVHHCSEVNRCIKKFDHFCPWVGGPIGHSRYKFFFLFITYVAIYCIFITVTFGVAVSQRRSASKNINNARHIPANPGLWYACIALGSFFGLMMAPFSFFHGRQIAINKSTIEYLDTRGAQIIAHISELDEYGNEIIVRRRITLEPEVNPFDLGMWKNWQQVMGPITFDRWVVVRILNWITPINGR